MGHIIPGDRLNITGSDNSNAVTTDKDQRLIGKREYCCRCGILDKWSDRTVNTAAVNLISVKGQSPWGQFHPWRQLSCLQRLAVRFHSHPDEDFPPRGAGHGSQHARVKREHPRGAISGDCAVDRRTIKQEIAVRVSRHHAAIGVTVEIKRLMRWYFLSI